MSFEKKYVIFVKNQEESKRVQERLFAHGYCWTRGSKAIIAVPHHFLYLYVDKRITQSDSFEYATGEVSNGVEPLNASSFYDKFPELEPEKMIMIMGMVWSESTIVAALKRYADWMRAE